MAVKCNIPNLALKSVHSIIYGFSCEDVIKKIVQNYLEYLKCPGVDYSFCDDFPCIAPGGDVFCFIDDVGLGLELITATTITAFFVPPLQNYIIQSIKVSNTLVIETKQNPTSPTTFTGLEPNTEYIIRLTLLCEGGEVKTTEEQTLTLPICVEIEDYTAVATDVNEYP